MIEIVELSWWMIRLCVGHGSLGFRTEVSDPSGCTQRIGRRVHGLIENRAGCWLGHCKHRERLAVNVRS